MQDKSPGGAVFGSRVEVPLEQIAAETAVNQVVVAVITPGDCRDIVVDGQVTARVRLGYAAVATTRCPVPAQNRASDGARRLLLSPRSCLARRESAFESTDLRVELLAALFQPAALRL